MPSCSWSCEWVAPISELVNIHPWPTVLLEITFFPSVFACFLAFHSSHRNDTLFYIQVSEIVVMMLVRLLTITALVVGVAACKRARVTRVAAVVAIAARFVFAGISFLIAVFLALAMHVLLVLVVAVVMAVIVS